MGNGGRTRRQRRDPVHHGCLWIDTWLRSQYQGLERRYIIHDAAAKEVDEETFYHTRESGGTRISTAYKVALNLIKEKFDPSQWNIYAFQFSDGDNWGEDNRQSLGMLKDEILPMCNLFCYGQVESPYGSGEYIRVLEEAFGSEHEQLVLSEIASKEAIYESIKTFLGKGK